MLKKARLVLVTRKTPLELLLERHSQDGLVPNVAKYLDGQLTIGINPDPQRNDELSSPKTKALEVVSAMGEDGVIFADGLEADRLDFAVGQTARIRVAQQRLHLVVPARPN